MNKPHKGILSHFHNVNNVFSIHGSGVEPAHLRVFKRRNITNPCSEFSLNITYDEKVRFFLGIPSWSVTAMFEVQTNNLELLFTDLELL